MSPADQKHYDQLNVEVKRLAEEMGCAIVIVTFDGTDRVGIGSSIPEASTLALLYTAAAIEEMHGRAAAAEVH